MAKVNKLLFKVVMVIGEFLMNTTIATTIATTSTPQPSPICITNECHKLTTDLATKWMNLSTDPCDDFYTYTCGKWIETNYPSVNQPPFDYVEKNRKNVFTVKQVEIFDQISATLKTILNGGDEMYRNFNTQNIASNDSNDTKQKFLSLVRNIAQLNQDCLDESTVKATAKTSMHSILNRTTGGWPLLDKSSNNTTDDDNQPWHYWFIKTYLATGIGLVFDLNVVKDWDLKRNLLRINLANFEISRNPSNEEIEQYRTRLHLLASRYNLQPSFPSTLSADIDKIVAFQIDLINASKPYIIARKVLQFSEVDKLTSGTNTNWTSIVNQILTDSGVKNDEIPHVTQSTVVRVEDTIFLQNVIKLFTLTPGRVIRNFFASVIVSNFDKFIDSNEDPYNYSTWSQQCIQTVLPIFPNILERLFADHHFTSIQQNESLILIDEIKNTFHDVIHNENWLDNTTKAAAEHKLSTIKQYVGYTEWIQNTDKLLQLYHRFVPPKWTVVKGNFLDSFAQLLGLMHIDNVVTGLHTSENVSMLSSTKKTMGNAFYDHLDPFNDQNNFVKKNIFKQRKNPLHQMRSLNSENFDYKIRKYSNKEPKVANHHIWLMSSLTPKVFYRELDNSITIPAGILQDPFFNNQHPISMNYGSIGFLLGREFTHGVDSTGRNFDENGQMKNWWTQDTNQNFVKRKICFGAQYTLDDPYSGFRTNGEETIRENIADSGGVKIAYEAMNAHVKKFGPSTVLPPPPSGDNHDQTIISRLSAEQLFFVSYGKTLCEAVTKQAAQIIVRSDEHAPARYRVNLVLSNFEPFSRAFNCPVKSRMNPTKRCELW